MVLIGRSRCRYVGVHCYCCSVATPCPALCHSFVGMESVGSMYNSIQAEGGSSFTPPLPTLVPSLDSLMLQFPHPVPFLRPGMVALSGFPEFFVPAR